MTRVRLLLDTHTFLWWRGNHPRLGEAARTAIASAEMVFVSAVSAWEAAIKAGLGRLRIPEPFEVGVAASGFEELPITFLHAQRLEQLPAIHRDPFDRMLIAQALVEELTLVSEDRTFREYGVRLLGT